MHHVHHQIIDQLCKKDHQTNNDHQTYMYQATMAEEVDVVVAEGADVGVRYARPPVVAAMRRAPVVATSRGGIIGHA